MSYKRVWSPDDLARLAIVRARYTGTLSRDSRLHVSRNGSVLDDDGAWVCNFTSRRAAAAKLRASLWERYRDGDRPRTGRYCYRRQGENA